MRKLNRHQRTRLGLIDVAREAWYSLARSPARSLFTAMGMLLGTAAFIVTLGMTATLSNQVSASFDLRRATTVVVDSAPEGSDAPATETWASAAALERARTLAGVEAIGTRIVFPDQPLKRSTLEISALTTDVYLMDTDTLEASTLNLTSGRAFDPGHVRRADTVVLLSKSIAEQLGGTAPGSAVILGKQPMSVIGIYDDAERGSEVLGGIIIPTTVGDRIGDTSLAAAQVLVKATAGAATQVGRQIPMALTPEGTILLKVLAPPDLSTLRQEVEGNITSLSLLLSGITLLIGTFSIGTASTSAIVLRTQEIGLRRALGARGRHIFIQLLGETTVLGILGGALGSFLGLVALITISLANKWVPVIDLTIVSLAIFGSGVAGCLAGIMPARMATRIEPADALTR